MGWRVNGETGADGALQQKKKKTAAPSRAGFQVEPLAEIFVGGDDIQFPVDGQEHRRDDDERDGHAEVKIARNPVPP